MINRIVAECEAIAELQASCKARAMIYQADVKEQVARHNGVAFDAYYHLPYAEWAAVYDRYREEQNGLAEKI
jgi:hypothetical protein